MFKARRDLRILRSRVLDLHFELQRRRDVMLSMSENVDDYKSGASDAFWIASDLVGDLLEAS